jgi:MFS-type transporter involved in bile tolerance (Atg22 family)
MAMTGSVQSGILSILLFFIFGTAILLTVNEKKGFKEEQKPVI